MRILAVALCITATVAAQQQLPNVTDLLKDVRAHQQNLDDIRENYTFHQLVRTDELDDKGAIKKTSSEEREVFFVNGYRVGRLVKKDGKPLAPTDEKKEQDRIKKLVEQRSKQPRVQPGSRGGLISMILTVSKVSNPRRATLKGRPSLAYDFAGEADRQVARREIHFFDNFRIAGGLLATVQKGTSIELEQSPVGEGLWMQTSLAQHVGARLGFVSTREDEHVTNFDFKKFDVAMHQEIHPD